MSRYIVTDTPDATSFHVELYKASNGHLAIVEISGWKYRGQDWGETVGQWREQFIRLNDVKPHIKRLAIEIGQQMKSGETVRFNWWNYFPQFRRSNAKHLFIYVVNKSR